MLALSTPFAQAAETRISPSRLRSIVIGGARVSVTLAERAMAAFPEVRVRVLYGSTEAEPIAVVDAAEVVSASGDGALVGRSSARSICFGRSI